MISIKDKSDNFVKTLKFFKKSLKITRMSNADAIARKCVDRLIEVTPKDSGLTAESWTYSIIKQSKESVTIQFNNSNIQDGVNVAILVEYGHLSPSGTWVSGQNFVRPTVQQAYMEAINEVWKEMETA